MSADAYSLKVFESGAQLRLARQPLLEQRARQSKLWRRSERDLFRLTAMVAEREHPLYRDLRADTPFSVDFRDEPGLEDPQIQNAVWEKRIQMGLMSQVDALMEIHPDWDRETATKEAQRIVDERAIWVGMVKEMQTAAGSIDSAGATPQENGAKGGRPPGPPPPVQPGQMPTEPAPPPDGGPKY
jgi:hypothetical protein